MYEISFTSIVARCRRIAVWSYLRQVPRSQIKAQRIDGGRWFPKSLSDIYDESESQRLCLVFYIFLIWLFTRPGFFVAEVFTGWWRMLDGRASAGIVMQFWMAFFVRITWVMTWEDGIKYDKERIVSSGIIYFWRYFWNLRHFLHTGCKFVRGWYNYMVLFYLYSLFDILLLNDHQWCFTSLYHQINGAIFLMQLSTILDNLLSYCLIVS